MTDRTADWQSLSPGQRRELLKRMLRERRRRVLPASFGQEQLWLVDRMGAGAAYNLVDLFQIRGDLRVPVLTRSLDAICERHESLRTTFISDEGIPRQVIQPASPRPLPVIDLCGLPASRRIAAVEGIATDQARTPFDLARGPLLRTLLLRLDGGRRAEHVLLVSYHHIITDGTSQRLFYRELVEGYRALRRGRVPQLPTLPIQYGDYARRQKQWAATPDYLRQLAYWRQQLGGDRPLPVLELPTDRPRPAVQTFGGASREFVLGPDLSASVVRLARRRGVTLHMLLLAAFQALLAKLAGQDEVVVGTPVAGRNQLDLENLIGFFVNTLVVRSDLSGDPSFEEVLRRIKETLVAAYDHQDAPLEKLVEELAPERDPSRNPLFQVSFAVGHAAGFEPARAEDLELRGYQAVRIGDTRTSRFDLQLNLFEVAGVIRGRLVYNPVLFDATTAAALSDRLAILLAGVARDPGLRLSQLPILSAAQRSQLLVEWNDTAGDDPPPSPVHRLFEDRAAESRDAIAVSFGDGQLSYGELDRRANQLAHYLIGLGVAPEAPVGICVERGPEMVIGILGILKAGGVYVPIDRSNPAERIGFMLDDFSRGVETPVVITRGLLAEGLVAAGGTAVRAVALDAERAAVAASSGAPPAGGNAGAELDRGAYLIYTSGSTGIPKAVAIGHRELCHYLRWAGRRYRSDLGVGAPVNTSIAFDATVTSLFLPLIAGRRVFLLPEEGELEALAELLASGIELTLVKLTPAHLVALRGLLGPRAAAVRARAFVVGGEALRGDVAAFWRRHVPALRLFNEYGPTEAVVGCCVQALDRDAEVAGDVPIGTPTPSTRLYVLGGALEPLPAGVAGELHIGGRQLARGYFERPRLTAEKFTADPFAGASGARLYKTGDRARRLPDGRLEFLGRIDHQVKIRGFRIELGEIEAALGRHHQVREAVVLLLDPASGDPRLVACVVADEPLPDLGVFLGRHLPSYMVPASVLRLDALPLTPNGKLDRRRLTRKARAEIDGARPEQRLAAPRTPVEELLANIWREVLDLDELGVDDDFFELGGHSLKATQVVSRVRRTFELELPLAEVFGSPTVAGLAVRIDALRRGEGRPAAPPILPLARDAADWPLSFAQQRLWFLDQLGAGAAYNMSRAFRLSGELEVAALAASLCFLVRRHESLRTRFVSVEGVPRQVVAEDLAVAVPILDLSALGAAGEAEARRQARAELWRPFDLAAGPLLRARLLRLAAGSSPAGREAGPADHILLLTMHHIISDGWSMGVLIRELEACYPAFAAGRSPGLPELPVQYIDFAVWQRRWLQGEVLDDQLAYWRRRLGEDPPVLELPADRPRPAVQTFAGGEHRSWLPATLYASLKALSREHGVTPAMTLGAAFKTLLHRYTHRSDVMIGSPIANRGAREIEDLIGFFVNSLVMRSDLSGDPPFAQLLRREGGQALEAYEHQDLPFERLVDELDPERDLGQNPLFQVIFAVQNVTEKSLALPGLAIDRFDAGLIKTRFDLEVYLRELPGGLIATLVYNLDLFDATTVGRLAGYFLTLLEGVAADPETRLSRLPMLKPAQRHQLFHELNDTASGQAGGRTVRDRFLEQVARAPAAVALTFGEHQLSYGELGERSLRLARQLVCHGVAPGVRVGLCVESSPEMVVGMLAVILAGGAYVPLAPDTPPSRLAYMLEDSGAAVLLTRDGARDEAPALGVRRLGLDAGERRSEGTEVTLPEIIARHLAYVIYTSGSTGWPKGVEVDHGGLSNLVAWHRRAYSVTPEDRATQIAAVTFDACVWELWPYLATGASVHIAGAATRLAPRRLWTWLAERRVTLSFLPTPLAEAALSERIPAGLALRVLMTGGDRLRRAPEERLPFALINHYGPTESSVVATAGRVGAVSPPPIGRPIGGVHAHVLGRRMERAALGVAGELYLSGDSLARGYLDRPALTASCFVPEPWTVVPGARQYRTGDLVRIRSDGQIDFLGRTDHQVKIRGFRIELGEIEAALCRHPGVREAVVAVGEDVAGNRRLVGYVIPGDGGTEGEAPAAAWQEEHVEHWHALYEQAYGEGEEADDPTFHITGWDSSYTGQPIPAEEMRQWVDQTVTRIAAQAPRRVLEIGCGTGLLLFRIAPSCRHYRATDFSQPALDHVARHRRRHLPATAELVLERRLADDFEGIVPRSFDTVILNSIIQYFPGVDYLVRVVEGAVEAVRDGGTVFVGDVRNLKLLAAHHASVQLHRASSGLGGVELRQRFNQQLAQEQELVVDPTCFLALADRLGRIRRVDIELKRGTADNELTRFRYDVTLRVGSPVEASARPAEIRWLDWKRDDLSLAAVRSTLAREAPEHLGIRRVPNARTGAAAAAAEILAGDETVPTLACLEERVAQLAEAGVDPEDLWALEDDGPYRAELSWAAAAADGSYDALFVRRDQHLPAMARRSPPAGRAGDSRRRQRSLGRYVNNPLDARVGSELVPRLKTCLQDRLPEYMVPQAFVVLDRMPLSAHGKVDRKQLAALERQRSHSASSFVAPRTPAEQRVIEIWQEVLRLDQVGVFEDFFELGGHSLLATQVVSRVRETFGVELPLTTMFSDRTVSALAARVEELASSSESPRTQPIPPVVREQADWPLSFAQRRLWFLDQLDTGSAYYSASPLRLSGRLDVCALTASLNGIVRRHEALRTVFRTTDGRPRQVVRPPLEEPLRVVDLSALAGADRESQARRHAAGETRRRFDLARGPLLRSILLRLGAREYVLILTMHHIVFDGWSLGILQRELEAHYRAGLARRPPDLPELPVQYVDFACWQRRWLAGSEELRVQLDYWRRQLDPAPPVVELPTDRARPPVQSFGGGVIRWTIQAALQAALESLSRKHGATLVMTLQAAFKTLLHRITGQRDLAVGTPIANRNRREIEGLIGFFVNTLVMRSDLAGDPAFGELVDRERAVALAAYAHQDVPFELLVQELEPERDLSRNPLFQVMFAVQNAPTDRLSLPGLAIDRFETGFVTTRFDLEVHLWESLRGLEGVAIYSTELFDATTVAALSERFQRLLAGIAGDPGLRLSQLPLLSAAERSQLLVEWNDSAADPPAEACLHHLVAAPARRLPSRIALVHGDRHLSYGELDRRSERLAGDLRALGVAPDARVGLCVERGLEMVVGVLAILRAGGGYVPLDPTLPGERLRFMLADSGCSMLLTSRGLRAAAPVVDDLCRHFLGSLIHLDDVPGASPAAPGAAGGEPGAEHLAYVLYTSGSTGRPKGVGMAHGPLVNLMAWQLGQSPAAAGTTLQFAPPSFDVSCQEIFSTLGAGGTLCLLSEEVRRDPEALLALLRARAVARIFMPYVALRQLAEAAGRDRAPAALEEVITAGEQPQVDEALVRFFDRLPRAVLVNQYGPTECHVVSSLTLAGAAAGWPARPAIGRPIANLRLYVLDRRLRPAPAGVAGELVLGGAGLARGYLERPGLTAERFVPDPWARRAGARLYRTGDLVRQGPGGEVAFVGRIDHQVKVRGFRIELGEIESLLRRHDAVREAVVTVAEEAGGDRRLVGYVVPESAGAPDGDLVARLQAHLAASTPDYMVPQDFVVLEALPLTPNGKVDRRRLPAPSRRRARGAADYAAPRNPTEERLVEIWCQVLGLDGVGIFDNFFKLGGHSLKVTQVVSRVRQTFGVELPVSALFKAPTVAEQEVEVTRRLVEREDEDELARMIAEVEGLSEEELGSLLADGES